MKGMTAAQKRKYAKDVRKEKLRVIRLLRPFLRPGVRIECDNILAGEGFLLRFKGRRVGITPIGDDMTYLSIGGDK